MKVLGVLLLVVGLVTAIASIGGLGQPAGDARGNTAIVGDQNQSARDQATSLMLRIIAGLTIAAGGVLVGIGMGHFENPKIVPPDSPQAAKAATTEGTTGKEKEAQLSPVPVADAQVSCLPHSEPTEIVLDEVVTFDRMLFHCREVPTSC